jgi:hypothetical protein
MFQFEFQVNKPRPVNEFAVSTPLPKELLNKFLLKLTSHVDHEGFDLNEIEQAYYYHNGISLSHDTTWYKDGGKSNGTNAVLYPWIAQIPDANDKIIIDHSHFVFRYPIVGQAREQLLEYSEQRPELLRLLSATFKCGLDLCIDYINLNSKTVEPLVHIEWDYSDSDKMQSDAIEIETILKEGSWVSIIPAILHYNKLAKKNNVDAFSQADTRSMLLFASKSYKLIPTL